MKSTTTTSPAKTQNFELTFWGGTNIRHRRWHSTFEQAEGEARRALSRMDNRRAHPAIIYGPDLGRDGKTVA